MIRPLFVVCVFVAIVPASAFASNAIHQEFRFFLHENDFVALRFNLSGASDLRLSGRVELCGNETSVANGVARAYREGNTAATLGIMDGRLGTPGIEGSASLPTADAGAMGAHLRDVNPNTAPNCDFKSTVGGSASVGWARSQFTFIELVRNPVAYYNVTVHATFGVTSFDVAHGKGRILAPPEWNSGAFVGLSGKFGPAAGVAIQESTFDHDSVSAYKRAPFEPVGFRDYQCELNGDVCPSIEIGTLSTYQADGASHRRHQLVEAAIDAADRSLVEIPLPDDDYVTGNLPWSFQEMNDLCKLYCPR